MTKILKRSVREVYSKVEEVTIPFDTIAFTKIQKELEEAKQKVDRQTITIVTLEFKKKLKDDGIQKLHNLLTNRSFTYIGERGLVSNVLQFGPRNKSLLLFVQSYVGFQLELTISIVQIMLS